MNEQGYASMARMQDLDATGNHEALLACLEELYAHTEASPAPARTDYFMTMFQWGLLSEKYPPAARALGRARDEQARRLLAGERHTGASQGGDEAFQRVERFSLIVDMNEALGEPHATHALFLRVEAQEPELARRYAWLALPAIVDVGDFALAERYRGDPLGQLRSVNATAERAELFPAGRQAPRLAADLMSLTREVRIGMAVLHGLGRGGEARAVRDALLAGLANEELRSLAGRELDTPGTISAEVGRHQAVAWETP